ncbi:MAG TPA: M28 family peptidase, partial [Actinomycetota bacterium]|nr:M28 family peptidase [Actinomycetota bacterium]
MRVSARSRVALVTAIAAGTIAAAVPVGAAPSNNNSEKLRAAVTLEAVKSHLAAFQSIATAAGGNRFAGLAGHANSAEYVIDQLEAAGYAPVKHTFTYDAFFENTPSVLEQVSPTPASYVNGNDFRVMSYSGSGETSAPLAAPSGDSRGCVAADYAGFPTGGIALVQRGTPPGYTNPATGNACTFRVKTDNATNAGASAILVYNNVPGVVNGTLGATGLSAIPSLGLTQALGHSLLTQMLSSEVVMHVRTDTGSQPLETFNVLAEKTGTVNPDNVVMAGAHLDSVTAGPGINDNGTGSAAILETAIRMAKADTYNTVRFAWWSAEESGLIGASRYVASLTQEQRDEIALYLNFDMVGSPNFARFVYDGDQSDFPAPQGVTVPEGSDQIEYVFEDFYE